MKNKKGLKIIISVASVGFMFLGIYQFAFASTFGGSSLFLSDRSSIQTSSVSNENIQLVSASSSSTSSSVVTFTAEELAKYNGTNGMPAYVAVDGIVYDMTQIGSWKNGQHQGLSAGQDLTAAFANSPHSKSILDRSPIVGKFSTVKAPVKVVDSVSTATVNSGTGSNSGSAANTGAATNTGSTPQPASGSSSTTTASTVALPKTWTLDAVSKFNGIGGNPAYIVVNGTIYDVTRIGSWSGGVHKGIHAGQDVTNFFASSPHSASLLNQLPVMGKIGDTIASNTKVPVATVDTTSSASLSNSSSNDDDDDGDDHESDDDHEGDDDHDDSDDHDGDDDDHDDDSDSNHDEDDDHGEDDDSHDD